jgi:hypothetical protein
VDGRDLESLSSSGLREILFLAQKCNGVCQFKVINLNDACMEVFTATGFDSIMDISKAEEDLSTYTSLSFKALLAQKAEQFPDTIVLEKEEESYTFSEY